MYKKNDVVVYRRDVCRVSGKEKSDMTGEQCYVLEPYDKNEANMKMLVPVSNKAGHLRDLITPEEIKALIKNYDDVEPLEDKPANMKSQYVAMLKGDSIEDLIRIIKTSYMRNKARMDSHKKLAAIDGEYLEKAETYLFKELGVSLGKSLEQAKEYFIKEVQKQAQKKKAKPKKKETKTTTKTKKK